MQLPDITKAQVLALAQAVIATAVAFGLHITHQQQQAILGDAGLIATALILGDAIIRHGRSRQLAIAQRDTETPAAAAAHRDTTVDDDSAQGAV